MKNGRRGHYTLESKQEAVRLWSGLEHRGSGPQPGERCAGDGLVPAPPRKGGLIFHSNRCSQYASEDFRQLVDGHGIRPSMSSRGNCWNNAVTETLYGPLRVERLHGTQFPAIRAAKDEVLAWLLW